MRLKNGQSKRADRRTCVGDGKEDSQGSNIDSEDTPDEIRNKDNCSFTPPGTNLPGSLNNTGMS